MAGHPAIERRFWVFTNVAVAARDGRDMWPSTDEPGKEGGPMSRIESRPTGVPQEVNLDSEGLNRDVGFLALLWASEGSIIGSGWLFGAFYAVGVAGPSALIGWGIASIIIMILALVHAELGGLFPVTGGTSRFPHYAFGSFAGAVFGWFTYIQAAAVAPIEVSAALQYLSSAGWAHSVFTSKGVLSNSPGLILAAGLMLVFVAVNLVGIQWLARANTGITTWKVLFPIFAVIILLFTHFHSSNFSADGGFFIHGAAFKSIVETFPTGVIFALLGFEQAVQLGGESSNPKRDLPRAVIGSVAIGAVIYILAQVAFIGALDPKTVIEAKTWANLGTNVGLSQGPFYTVTRVAGIGWLAWALRADAVISPGGTGLIYLTSASRIGFGLSKNGYVPPVFEKTNDRKVPYLGIVITAVIGMLFLLPLPSWAKLVNVVTAASVLMYAAAPLALGALRRQKPDLPRAYRLPAGDVVAPIAFTLANYVVYYSGWQTYSTLMVMLVVGFILMGASFLLKLNPNRPEMDWTAALWIFPYFIGMGIISYIGGFGHGGMLDGLYGFKNTLVGGNGHLGIGYDNLVILIFSVAIYFLAVALRLPEEKVDHYVAAVYPPPVGE
jgi:amino acid transporter